MKTASQNKTAIVTGGGSGIGYAITEKFISEGIRTIIIGRDAQKLKKAKDKLGKLCVPLTFDLTDLKSIPRIVKQLLDDHPVIDILVNNAGINLKKEFTKVSDEEFNQIIQTNVSSVFALSRELVKHMSKNGQGKYHQHQFDGITVWPAESDRLHGIQISHRRNDPCDGRRIVAKGNSGQLYCAGFYRHGHVGKSL